MKRKLQTILLIFFTNILFAQSDIFQFDQIRISEAFKIEKQYNSSEYIPTYKISVAEDYFPNASKFKLVQPKVFNRINIEFIPLQVEYFYTKNDSIVRLIVYNWDTKIKASKLRDFLAQENDQSKRFKEYNKQYDLIAEKISSVLGSPTPNQGKIEKKSEKGYGEWYSREIIWNTDRCKTQLVLIWAEEKGFLGTYRIRTKIYWN